MARIVVALGGNALGSTSDEQKYKVGVASKALCEFIEHGDELIISHGNGPQVGMINLGLNFSAEKGAIKGEMPFSECTAMSQGYIGYHLQNALIKELTERGLNNEVVSVITQVQVSPNDSAFESPTKPIGSFYTEEEAKKKMAEYPEQTFKEDAGRGWRRVVPSPTPIDIVESRSILNLIKSGCIVIACGGGGIPVVKKDDGNYVGVDAVIDKDYASEKLAELVDADSFYILTAVDAVCVNFNKPEEKKLREITCEEAEKYVLEGQFAPGSMLPKVLAAVKFARSQKGRKAIICSLDNVESTISGYTGTIIHN